MRIGAVAVAVGAAMMLVVPAHADFVLGGARPTSGPAAPTSATPASPGVTAEPPEQTALQFKIARGFGNAVPMAFAVRQMVPAGVRVRYGAGIDPEALVSWKGDRPWNQALAAAVRPLRLRIVTGTDTVLITH